MFSAVGINFHVAVLTDGLHQLIQERIFILYSSWSKLCTVYEND